MITRLPLEIIETVLDNCDRNSHIELAKTLAGFRYLVNRKLYRKIMVVNQPLDKKGYLMLPLDRLDQFCQQLSGDNFCFIDRLVIHTQLDAYGMTSFEGLYKKLLKLWDQWPTHPLEVINYDLNNLRIHQSLNQFIYKHTSKFVIEDSCVDQTHVNYKINNLQNWMVFNYAELNQLPVNPNLKALHVFIERLNHQMAKAELVPPQVLANCGNLELLYLTTPLATSQFVRYFANYDGPLPFTHLKQLLICNLHSYKDNSLLEYAAMSRVVPFDQIESLELKLSCTHHDCDCILQFFVDMPPLPNLKHFMLINTNTKQSAQNMAQFQQLLELNEFIAKIANCELMYLNLNELNKLTLGARLEFKFSKLCNQLQQLPRLKLVVLPDFFNHWLASVPQFFDQTVNGCKCHQCRETRVDFAARAKRFSPRLDSPLNEEDNNYNMLMQNESLVKYLNYVNSQAKKQYRYINENLNSINSIITKSEKPVMKDTSLESYKKLFEHNCLGGLALQIKMGGTISVTMGGMEF